MIRRSYELILQQGLGNLMKDELIEVGRHLGEGIKESFGDSMSIKGILGFKTASATQTGEDPIAVIKESNKLLTEIRDKSVSKFA